MTVIAAAMTFATAIPALAATITITPGVHSSTSKADRFAAYQIFKGTPSKDNPSALADITWGDGINSDGLVSAMDNDNIIKDAFSTEKSAWNVESNPQKDNTAALVAKFLSKQENNSDVLKAFAKLAAAQKKGSGKTSTFADGNWTITVDSDGYYLIVDKVEKESNESASSYILDVAGSASINMKSSIPTVDKTVTEVKKKGNVSDNGETDGFIFTITGTVAENISDYTAYKYEFLDTLSAGLTADMDTIAVKIGENEIAKKNYTVTIAPLDTETNEEHTLSVSIDNLLDSEKLEVPVTKESIIVVTYKAYLNKFAIAGKKGNENSVKLKFSNDPYNAQEGISNSSATKTYEYGLKIVKYDGSEDEEVPLEGAEFVLKKNIGQFATLDEMEGSYSVSGWGDEQDATKVQTGKGGVLNINGIGNGTYTLKETKAPDGYDTMKEVEFTVNGDVAEQTGELQNVSVSMTSPERKDATLSVDGDDQGMINVKLINYKSTNLPGTGGAGTIVLYILSIIIGVVGVAGMIMAFRKRGQSDKKN